MARKHIVPFYYQSTTVEAMPPRLTPEERAELEASIERLRVKRSKT